MRVMALTSSPSRVAGLRALGARPIVGNLDDAPSLRRFAGLATRVLHLAPPPGEGAGGNAWWLDPRTVALARALRLRSLPVSLVYASTSGVYGDCQGALVPETRAVAPGTPRAQRRVNAETAVRHLGRAGVRASVLRIPGIYAPDREGGTPEARLRRGTPVLVAEDDVFTNHIHADDLARACVLALHRGRPQRSVNVCDDSALRMGDHYDRVADLCGLARPPRLSREQAQAVFSAMQWSFMNESRRIGNHRLKQELGLALRYPGVEDALRDAASAATPGGPAVAGDTPGPISGTLPGRA